MTSFDIEVRSIAEMLCLRPMLFTATGSLAEILAFFDGYESAQRNSQARDADDSPSRALDWLAAECSFVRSFTMPSDRLAHIMERFQTESNVLDSILTYSAEYRRANIKA